MRYIFLVSTNCVDKVSQCSTQVYRDVVCKDETAASTFCQKSCGKCRELGCCIHRSSPLGVSVKILILISVHSIRTYHFPKQNYDILSKITYLGGMQLRAVFDG